MTPPSTPAEIRARQALILETFLNGRKWDNKGKTFTTETAEYEQRLAEALEAGAAALRRQDEEQSKDHYWPVGGKKFRNKENGQIVDAIVDPSASDWMLYAFPKPQEWAQGGMRNEVFHRLFDEVESIPAAPAGSETEPRPSIDELRANVIAELEIFDTEDAKQASAHVDALIGAVYAYALGAERRAFDAGWHATKYVVMGTTPDAQAQSLRNQQEAAFLTFVTGANQGATQSSGVNHGSAAPEHPRACGCAEPDAVMQADGKFYCHRCSFETGARPTMLEPESLLRRVITAESQLAEARQQIAVLRAERPQPSGTEIGFTACWKTVEGKPGNCRMPVGHEGDCAPW